jgi:hypothetical protein
LRRVPDGGAHTTSRIRALVQACLDGQERHAVPLLDFYFAYVPWTRGIAYYGATRTEWTAYSSVRLERGEYRLSTPIGVSFERPENRNASTGRVAISLVPEITVAHHDLEPADTEYSRIQVKQVFAMFLVIRLEGVLVDESSK